MFNNKTENFIIRHQNSGYKYKEEYSSNVGPRDNVNERMLEAIFPKKC